MLFVILSSDFHNADPLYPLGINGSAFLTVNKLCTLKSVMFAEREYSEIGLVYISTHQIIPTQNTIEMLGPNL